MDNDLKKIKKLYGENMMHLCRELFPTLLEKEGLLPNLLTENFYPTKFLYDDIKEQHQEANFKDYIYECVGMKNNNLMSTNKTPEELLSEAGYDLYECNSEKDIQHFKKYYQPNEELCTFHGGRLNNCHVFFAVKKNVNEIKRRDFLNPQRQDEYGTSVISIQFTKGDINTLSIKNRYNHTVNNPDATFSNNLENIIPGLTKSFEKKYHLNINQNKKSVLCLDGYVQAEDSRFYKYNLEENNIYYCPDNIIIDNFEVKKLEPEKYLLMDYFILDLQNKKITLYDKSILDSFIYGIDDIENIQVIKKSLTGNKEINISTKDNNEIVIEIDNTNQIITYKNLKITRIGDDFLSFNDNLSYLELPNLIEVGDCFLEDNHKLNQLELPNLVRVGYGFIQGNKVLSDISLPKLEIVTDRFLFNNERLESINLPSLRETGDYFICLNPKISKVDLPNLTNIGHYFLMLNNNLETLNLPSAVTVGVSFLTSNYTLSSFDAPKLKKVDNGFLCGNKNLKKLYLPNLTRAGEDFIFWNKKLSTFVAPELKKVGSMFLYSNEELKCLELPNLETTQSHFLYNNKILEKIEIPNLVSIDHNFLAFNLKLTSFYAPLLQHATGSMLFRNENIQSFVAPNLDEESYQWLSKHFKIITHNTEDELYETTIVDVSKETVEHKKEKAKVRCKNGQ